MKNSACCGKNYVARAVFTEFTNMAKRFLNLKLVSITELIKNQLDFES